MDMERMKMKTYKYNGEWKDNLFDGVGTLLYK